MFSKMWALVLSSVIEQHQRERDQADQHVNGVKAGHQEVGAGPHVAAGNDHRQGEVVILVSQAMRIFLQLVEHFEPARKSLLLGLGPR